MNIRKSWMMLLLTLSFSTALQAESHFCHVNKGFSLINQDQPPFSQVEDILKVCDKEIPRNVQVMMLHGLLARKEGLATHQYAEAINWFQKAQKVAPPNDLGPTLELAVTYEWANQPDQAKAIYVPLLTKNHSLRPALLGSARVALAQNDPQSAMQIYQALLLKKPNDTDALNGLGRVNLATKHFQQAEDYFQQVLTINPKDPDALLGVQQIQAAMRNPGKPLTLKKSLKPPCDANEGLRLLNQPKPAYTAINKIVIQCDKYAPHDVQTYLLHGLIARKQVMPNGQYQLAIDWLQKAKQVAKPDNNAPALELAVTYEWSNQPDQAKRIYTEILARDPNSRPALLGLARVDRAQYHLHDATCIYTAFLQKNPHDTDALAGMGWVKLTNKELSAARLDFGSALSLNPQDAEAKVGLELTNNTTRYLLALNTGQYSVSHVASTLANINFYADINATDQFILQLTHNSKEIQLALVLDPTILPKNDVFVGFERQIPNQYGWGVNYEYRERSKFRLENRLGANVNFFLLKNFEWYIAAWDGFPSPWNNQLYYSGVTLFTSLPVNFGLTGFWGSQQFGGGTSAYSFDLSKEFANRTYYDIGTAYSPSQKNWEIHGRLILPTFKNQALESIYEHYYFNGTTAYSVGWRFYW